MGAFPGGSVGMKTVKSEQYTTNAIPNTYWTPAHDSASYLQGSPSRHQHGTSPTPHADASAHPSHHAAVHDHASLETPAAVRPTSERDGDAKKRSAVVGGTHARVALSGW